MKRADVFETILGDIYQRWTFFISILQHFKKLNLQFRNKSKSAAAVKLKIEITKLFHVVGIFAIYRSVLYVNILTKLFVSSIFAYSSLRV